MFHKILIVSLFVFTIARASGCATDGAGAATQGSGSGNHWSAGGPGDPGYNEWVR